MYNQRTFSQLLLITALFFLGACSSGGGSDDSGGLGGWDDHSGALDNYIGRIQRLMETLRAAARHLELAAADNIVINVFGDFGRNVNINDSNGWDHGNNQNFFTIDESATVPNERI